MPETDGGAGVAAGIKRPAPDDGESSEVSSLDAASADDTITNNNDKLPTAPPIDPALIARCEAASREERLRKNREKARNRRNRKKAFIEGMQKNVALLSGMNADLRKKNLDIIRQLAQYGAAGHPGTLERIEVSLFIWHEFVCVLKYDICCVAFERRKKEYCQRAQHL